MHTHRCICVHLCYVHKHMGKCVYAVYVCFLILKHESTSIHNIRTGINAYSRRTY